jgi:uncharacterized SAM-binding protein YcdF (DUF218 family)
MEDLLFIASKTITQLAMPDRVWLAAFAGGTVLLITPFRRIGRTLVLAALLLLGVTALTPLPDIAMRTLEQRFPNTTLPGRVDGIIVLGGFLADRRRGAGDETPFTRSAERFTSFVTLARRHPEARLVFAGGSGALFPGEGEGAGFTRLWQEAGLPGRDVIIEERSRNTFENAVFAHALVAPGPSDTWLLVTTAYHMPRAVGVFRAAGWPEPVTVAVDWRARYTPEGTWEGPSIGGPGTHGLEQLTDAWREALGLVAYRLLGRTEALFPAPRQKKAADQGLR